MSDVRRCLMEEVAWRAGEPVRDRPRGTHPALALLAQQVHDRSRPAARAALAAHVPALTGAHARDPRAGWALVEVCARHALDAAPPQRVRRVAERLARRAARRRALLARGLHAAGSGPVLRAAAPAIALARLPELAVALRCVLAAVPPGPARDRSLAALLAAATAAVRALDPVAAAERPAPLVLS